jgi:hypothetical protein
MVAGSVILAPVGSKAYSYWLLSRSKGDGNWHGASVLRRTNRKGTHAIVYERKGSPCVQ